MDIAVPNNASAKYSVSRNIPVGNIQLAGIPLISKQGHASTKYPVKQGHS
jgi:hypothetical protein